MASKKKKAPESAPGVPLWMVTYGDMMTLLLCFFILLFSFSTIDVVKFRDVIIELQGALGVLSGGPMVLNLGDIPAKQVTENPAVSTRKMEEIQEEIEDKIEDEELQGSVQTVLNERGLLIRFTDTVLYDIGSADIKPEAMPILDVINEELAQISNRVQIEGHTDPTPIHTVEFPSNWELSTARATAIVHYMLEFGSIEPTRLTAAGYSFYHPVVPNTTPENRARNRRVDVIILQFEDQENEFLEETGDEESMDEDESAVEADVEGEPDEETVESDEEPDETNADRLEFLESGESDGVIMEIPPEESGGSENEDNNGDPVEATEDDTGSDTETSE